MEEIVTMSIKELERVKVLSLVRNQKLSQLLAAKHLSITDRHVRRLLKAIENKGDSSIISKKRGKPSNRSYDQTIKEKAMKLIKDHYLDFGPKLAKEYLEQEHGICISKETLRIWMIEAHYWIPKDKGQKKLHPPRERRRAFGELIQVDGSHHDWFEGRSNPCVLMVYIDDATSMITSLYFSQEETFEAYAQGFIKHIKTYGIPLSLYGDRCAVLTPREQKSPDHITQFHKSIKELKCELLLARTPQAKGRVERANRTLQDRLVKMLRIKGINSPGEANQVLEDYRKEHNRLFSKKPSEQMNAHRSLEGICLEDVFCIRKTRVLYKDLTVQFENTFYKISTQDPSIKLYKGLKIDIRKPINRKQIAFIDGKRVDMVPLNEFPTPVIDSKQLQNVISKTIYTPPKTHPYKRKIFIKTIRSEMLQNVV